MILTEQAKTARPSESMHWYGRDGSSAYEVIGNNGQNRPATLRDARKLNLVPSVTTIIKSAAAPGLEVWKQQQMMMAALTLPRLDDEPEAAWLDRVIHDSKETGRKAAERGNAIHAACQNFYEGKSWGEYQEHVIGTNEAINAHFGVCSWFAEQSFAHPLGFGGKVDLYCESAVCDFKTKEFNDASKKLAWDEHCMQLAAYRVGLDIPKARCANVFVSVTKPGLAIVHEWTEEELAKGWRMFKGLLDYWKAKTGFESGWNA